MPKVVELRGMPGFKPGALGLNLRLPCLGWATGLWDSVWSTAVSWMQMCNPPGQLGNICHGRREK